MKDLGRYWGYIGLAVLLWAWTSPEIQPVMIVFISTGVTFYFLFQAPVWCGAITRDETMCRKNAAGLLMGCSLRQHKWQKLRMAFVPHTWKRLNRGLWSNPSTGLATISTIVGILSGLAGLILILFR